MPIRPAEQLRDRQRGSRGEMSEQLATTVLAATLESGKREPRLLDGRRQLVAGQAPSR
jgi:hypothetical protein